MDICASSATDLLAAMKTREISAVDVMQASLDRIARDNGALNAVVALADPDDLIAQARAADAAPQRGALHGLPIAVKDLANAAGFPTSMGSPIFAGQGPVPKDEIMVARMRAAGAIVIGKTNTPEFGLGSHTFNPVHGPTRNPYDHGRSAGGSSGGAAVALASGMIPIADGSDMMGSLRNPAGWNNVYGMRPSWGLVPSEPLGDTFLHQLSTLGPMGRTPQDVALLLSVQAGPDPRQPHGRSAPDLTKLSADVRGRRIGWLGDWGGALPMEAGVMDTCASALQLFEGLGCSVEQVPAPFDRDALWESWIALRSWSVAAGSSVLYAQDKTRALLKPEAIWELERGLALSAMDIHRASLIRSRWFEAAAALFDKYDALVLPTAQVWPFDVDLDWPKDIAGVAMDTYHRWMEVVVPVSLIGLPCLAVPAGFGSNGLPMGLQVFGRRGADRALLELGAAWHSAADWVQRSPDPA